MDNCEICARPFASRKYHQECEQYFLPFHLAACQSVAECTECGRAQYHCSSPFFERKNAGGEYHSLSFSYPGKEGCLPHVLLSPE